MVKIVCSNKFLWFCCYHDSGGSLVLMLVVLYVVFLLMTLYYVERNPVLCWNGETGQPTPYPNTL